MKPKLLLIPTEFEWRALSEGQRSELVQLGFQIEICGFGLVASGIRAAQLLSRKAWESVSLIGIAGRLTTSLEIGAAYQFDTWACYGIGVGSGTGHRTASELNWSMFQSPYLTPQSSAHIKPNGETIAGLIRSHDERFTLSASSSKEPRLLVSVAAASQDDVERESKLVKFPDALAEDMESYAVAAACYYAKVPFYCYRGISNHAGDREHSRWQIQQGMVAAQQLVVLETQSRKSDPKD